MSNGRRVMITGVSRYLGARLARELSADPQVGEVVGVDTVPPRLAVGTTRFVRTDLRTPGIARIVDEYAIDTVVHAGVLRTPAGAGGRAAMKEINIGGTMQLIAACQRAESVERFVLKSSTAVYGSGPSDPAVFGEDDVALTLPSAGFPRDSVDVEDAVRRLARTRPDLSVAMIRLVNVVGPRITTPMTRYLSLPLVPTMLGFDPRWQVVHEDDAVEALRRATLGTVTGAVNVAGDGVLLLSQAIARLGRVPLPVALPAGRFAARLLGVVGLVEPEPEDAGFLSFGRVVDTTRMRHDLGFEPAFTGLQAIDSMRPAAPEPPEDSFVQFFSRVLSVVPDPEASADYLGRSRGGRDG